ncbi:hypothetical protein OK074_6680 [Actinobacteria bacterium OK074]|nr:hypothetical protein OK074_6680 [Actinobacteria bacterium OK074]
MWKDGWVEQLNDEPEPIDGLEWFGRELETALAHKGATQGELADFTGYKEPYVSQVTRMSHQMIYLGRPQDALGLLGVAATKAQMSATRAKDPAAVRPTTIAA